MNDLIPLSLLTAGQCAEISLVCGDTPHVHRLQELGMRTGAEVEMLQPGSPCIVRMGGQKLCFRGAESTSVLVRVRDHA